jgi:hypothetical protein
VNLVSNGKGGKWHAPRMHSAGRMMAACGHIIEGVIDYKDIDLVDSRDRCQNTGCVEARRK